MIKQPDYNKKLLKRKWQEKFFKSVKNKENFIGLCGPTPKGYLKIINSTGFKNVILVDNDSENLNLNTQVFKNFKKKLNISGQCGNINTMLNKDAFYDLDYCSCISTIRPYLNKIMKIKEFCLTIALRNTGGEEVVLNELFTYNRPFKNRIYREKGMPMMITYFYSIKS